jgi:pyruvate formate lyase activating enzyme
MTEKEALFYRALKNKEVQCQLCPHFCLLKENEAGKCHARQNIKGKLISLVYGKPCSVAVDPIEKKPLYHFLPGEKAFSIATAGCNLKCLNCQNASISQANPESVPSAKILPKKIILEAKKQARIIAYTYTEPTIFYEYMLDIAKIARKQKMKNAMVTNGFINPEPLNKLCKHIDASNIDLKSTEKDFYERVCGAKLEPVLEAIKIMKDKGVWIEITNLLIPEYNDSLYNIRKLVSWVRSELGADIPLHFTAFHPCYKLSNFPSTNPEILKKARKIAMEQGIHYAYTGNINDEEGNNTYCPKCKRVVIRRQGFMIIENKIQEEKCSCGEKIAGIWH